MNDMGETLAEIRSAGLLRTMRTVVPLDGARVRIDGREVLCFAGNDYLGLRRHPDVVAAAVEAVETFGLGAGASRLLAGTTPVHVELEESLARFTGRERSLLFPSGYQTNTGVLTALADQGDVVIIDALCHASIIDAARLSRARMRVFGHADLEKLEALLEKHRDCRRRFVVTEGVFSMDGDIAPLGEIAELAERHDAWVVLDDAHGFGVLGETGRGTAEHLGVTLGERTVYVATLSKALGSQGGFAAGSRDVIDILLNRARSFIYTTGLAPACAAGALAALRHVSEPSRRRRLRELASLTRRLLRRIVPDVPEGVTPIVPLIVGDVDRVVRLSAHLLDVDILAPAIRPPTVPKGTARLRISLSADHTAEDVDRLTQALAQAF